MDISTNSNAATVLRTLVYYDIFDYPLNFEEIVLNCQLQNGEKPICENVLNGMVKEGIVYFIDGYYSLQNKQDNIIARVKGNGKADKWMKKARRISAFISSFPYVRGVALSGSLSKGYIGDDPDIDYFIITSPDRLWVSRTLLILYKKIFLLNSYKYFCVNYFISTEDLEIEEKNIFTSTELATMIPVIGKEVNRSFIRTNRWVRAFFPNFSENDIPDAEDQKTGIIKRILESFFNYSFGDKLDTYLMNFTSRHWRKKFEGKMTDDEMDLVFKSSKKISKHHPRNFQKYVLNEYQKRSMHLEKEYKIKIGSPFYEMN